MRAYVDSATPARLVDRQTQQEITDFSTPNPNAGLERDPGHPFQIASYEWGVAYAGMLSAAEATGDARFSDFVARRFALIGRALPLFRALPAGSGPPFRCPSPPEGLCQKRTVTIVTMRLKLLNGRHRANRG